MSFSYLEDSIVPTTAVSWLLNDRNYTLAKICVSAGVETLIAILCVKLNLRQAVRACQASQTSYYNHASQLSGPEAD